MIFDELTLGILATIAGIMILSGWVPQIVKGYKTKKLDDVSKYLMIFVSGGAFLWMIYGIEKNDPYIIGVNVAAIVLTKIGLSMKFRYKKYNLP